MIADDEIRTTRGTLVESELTAQGEILEHAIPASLGKQPRGQEPHSKREPHLRTFPNGGLLNPRNAQSRGG